MHLSPSGQVTPVPLQSPTLPSPTNLHQRMQISQQSHARWMQAMNKRSEDRTGADVSFIATRLRALTAFTNLPVRVLFDFARNVYLEQIDEKITLFREGEERLNFFHVLNGTLEASIQVASSSPEDTICLCTLGPGCSLGFTSASSNAHSITVVTQEPCTLLRVNRRTFEEIWKDECRSSQQVPPGQTVVTRINGETGNCIDPSSSASASASTAASRSFVRSPDLPSASTIPSLNVVKDTKEPSGQLLRIGWVLRTCLMVDSPHLLRSRRQSRADSLTVSSIATTIPTVTLTRSFNKCITGSDLVEWLLTVSSQTPVRIHSRSQATSMWQVLFEDRVILPVVVQSDLSDVFQDDYTLYKFWFDCEGRESLPVTTIESTTGERELATCLSILAQISPDAHLRNILRKIPIDRTEDDISLILDELMQISALSELTASVKQELAHVISYEFYPKSGSLVFSQGDEGNWWYVIYRGSVNVQVAGKGTVCTLKEGEEFGKLALVNNKPRAATIITAEDNTQLFKVSKEDFNRILCDVEANTIRLKEHGKDVLILLRLPQSPSKLLVIAGTPEKMVEYCLESQLDHSWSKTQYNYDHSITHYNQESNGSEASRSHHCSSLYSAHLDLLSKDTFFEDFILTFPIFMSSTMLCNHLFNYYKCSDDIGDWDLMVKCKRRVVRFLHSWKLIAGEHFVSDSSVVSFLSTVQQSIKGDNQKLNSGLSTEVEMVMSLLAQVESFERTYAVRGIKRVKSDVSGELEIVTVNASSSLAAMTALGDVGSAGGGTIGLAAAAMDVACSSSLGDLYYQDAIRNKDEIMSRVYCADHTYTTLKYSMSTTALKIKQVAADKLQIREPPERLLLVEVKSNGERVIFNDKDINVGTGLSVNGRIFISLKDHLDALTPLPEQEGPKTGTFSQLDQFSPLDLAYHLTHCAWALFNHIHERELIFQVFSSHNLNKLTANLNLFLRQFEQVQYWISTEIVLCTSLSKRVQLLRKFIKTAQICKDYQNLHTFFAIVLGLSNSAVSRLSQTWERLPSKVKRSYAQLESLIDPSRNQRKYRLYLTTLEPPVIPFTPLLLKDMSFAHQGNRTYLDPSDSLVNFEKMQMLAQAMRTFRFCKSVPLAKIEPSIIAANATSSSPLNRKIGRTIQHYITHMHVIDSQKILTQMSHACE